jgi:hypothetical protein
MSLSDMSTDHPESAASVTIAVGYRARHPEVLRFDDERVVITGLFLEAAEQLKAA